MKEHIFYILWAAICAWVFTRFFLWVDAQFEFSKMAALAWIVNIIHSWGWAVRKVVFFILFTIFIVTGIHKLFGNWLLVLIGVVAIYLIVSVVVIVGWYFLKWIVSTL